MNKKIMIHQISVDRLLLDPENPRLSGLIPANPNRDQLAEVLWSEMAVDEVALSIAANGFFEEEPLFVVPLEKGKADPKKDRFYVVEGNRRLTAVLLLTDADLRKKVKATNLPPIDAALKA